MARWDSGEVGGGKGRCVTMVTMGHLRLTIGYLKANVVHNRLTLGHLRVTIDYFFL